MATASQFRVSFPAFADALAYSPEQVDYWLGIGTKLVSAERWASMTDHGIYLVAAHFLALSKSALRSAASGQAHGGVVSSKSVDKVSVSYDTTIGSVEGGGAWNQTTYGQQYAQLSRLFGAGGVQL